MSKHASSIGLVLALALAAACGGDGGSAISGPNTSTSPTLVPATIGVVSGSGQTAAAGTALASPFVVEVTTANGTPVPGATVLFSITSGTGTLTTTTAVTDASGEASVGLTLGAGSGAVQVRASVQGTTLATTLSATSSTLTPATVDCASTAPTALSVGQATAVSGTSFCVSGAAGAEYMLVPFNVAADARSRSAVTVQATNVSAVATPLASRVPNAIARAAVTGAAPQDFRHAFEARLRARDVAELTPMIPAARGWYAQRNAPGVRRSVVPGNVQIGSIVRLNANSDTPCSSPDYRGARVVAISQKAIVVADTLNPAGGYTQAEYQSVATTFDTLVDAVDTKNFGQPTDIDGNGHVIMFFTSAVNALTPRNSVSFIGGFFDSRDMFPNTAQNGLPACAASNVGEMFYLLVPDPSGMVNGNKFAKSFVTHLTIATTAHEYQHLINASRRLYVNTAAVGFEETWLDEGLAHVAEELLFYAQSGLGSMRDIDANVLRSSSQVTNAFGDDGIENFDRLDLYLANTVRNSPYADNDSLETRGATWSFLRYAADRTQPTAQETLWQKLVNSSTSGMANLQQVFGSNLPTLFNDWGVMFALDDVAGADTRYQFPSWNLRSVFEMPSVDGVYPLQTTSLTSGSPTSLAISGGTGAYLRFGVSAGRAAGVSWSAVPPTVIMTLVRLR